MPRAQPCPLGLQHNQQERVYERSCFVPNCIGDEPWRENCGQERLRIGSILSQSRHDLAQHVNDEPLHSRNQLCCMACLSYRLLSGMRSGTTTPRMILHDLQKIGSIAYLSTDKSGLTPRVNHHARSVHFSFTICQLRI